MPKHVVPRPLPAFTLLLPYAAWIVQVLAAEGGKGVPLNPDLSNLLQGLLNLDPRHRVSARNALASPYFSPRPGAQEERVSSSEILG